MKKFVWIFILICVFQSVYAQCEWNAPQDILCNAKPELKDVLASNDAFYYLYSQKIGFESVMMLNKKDNYGNNLWSSPVIVDSLSHYQSEGYLVKTSEGKIYAVWNLKYPGGNKLFCRNFTENGETVNPQESVICHMESILSDIQLTADSNGGFYCLYAASDIPLGKNLKLRRILANGTLEDDDPIIIHSGDELKYQKLLKDPNNLLYCFFAYKSQDNINRVQMSKINGFNLLSESLVDTVYFSFDPMNPEKMAIDVLALSTGRFVLADMKQNGSITVKVINNEGVLLNSTQIAADTTSTFSLTAVSDTTFSLVYNDDNCYSIKILSQSLIPINTYNNVYQENWDTYLLSSTYSNGKVIFRTAQAIPVDKSNRTSLVVSHNLVSYELSSLMFNELVCHHTYYFGYNKKCFEIYENNKLYSFYKMEENNSNLSIHIYNLTNMNLIYTDTDFLKTGIFVLYDRKSIQYNGCNLTAINGYNHFIKLDSNGENSDLYTFNLSSDSFVKDMKINNNNDVVFSYGGIFSDNINADIAGLCMNGESESFSMITFSRDSFVSRGDEYTWGVIRGSLSLDNIIEDVKNVHLLKLDGGNPDHNENLIQADKLIGVEDQYIFFYLNNQLKVIRFNDDLQLSPEWNASGTVLSTQNVDFENNKILGISQNEAGLLVVWCENSGGLRIIKTALLNPVNGNLILNPHTIPASNALSSQIRFVFLNFNTFVISYLYNNAVTSIAFSFNQSEINALWERSFSAVSMNNFDMKLIGSKLLYAFSVTNNNHDQIFVKTLSPIGGSDQFTDLVPITENFLYYNAPHSIAEIVASGDNNAFVTYNDNDFALKSQYIDMEYFVGTDETDTGSLSLNAKNYPNPFNPSTTIEFSLPKEQKTEVCIYNCKGQKVNMLSNGVLPSGKNAFVWDGKDESGRISASGIYFYRIKTDDKQVVKKITLIK